jgi:hypothetical protein
VGLVRCRIVPGMVMSAAGGLGERFQTSNHRPAGKVSFRVPEMTATGEDCTRAAEKAL